MGDARTFLGLSDEEQAFIDVKLALAESLRRRRVERGLTRAEFAGVLATSPSRVAKIKSGHRSISLDVLVRSLLALGATPRDLARIIAARRRGRAA